MDYFVKNKFAEFFMQFLRISQDNYLYNIFLLTVPQEIKNFKEFTSFKQTIFLFKIYLFLIISSDFQGELKLN